MRWELREPKKGGVGSYYQPTLVRLAITVSWWTYLICSEPFSLGNKPIKTGLKEI